jgi:hypothetical protein
VDLKLDATGDLDLTDNEFSLVTGAEAVAQDVRSRLLFFLGEWFLDTRLGVDWFGTVLVKNPNWPAIHAMFRKVIRETPGVREVTHLTFDFNAGTRTLVMDARGELEDDLGSFDFHFEELLLQRFSEAA